MEKVNGDGNGATRLGWESRMPPLGEVPSQGRSWICAILVMPMEVTVPIWQVPFTQTEMDNGHISIQALMGRRSVTSGSTTRAGTDSCLPQIVLESDVRPVSVP